MNEGKKDRRDPIRTKKTKPAVGNPIAVAHQKTGGSKAGAHKDKKAAEKKGDVKHKKSYTESLQEMTNAEISKIRADAESHAKKSIDKQSDARIAAKKNPPKEKSFMQKVGDKQIAMAKGAWKGLTQESEHNIPPDGTPEYDQFINRGGVNQKSPFDLGGADAYYGRQHDITKEYGFQKGSPEWDEYIQGYRDTYQNSDMRKDYGSSRSAVQPRRITRTPEAMNGITGPGMMRDPAMEDEGDKEGLPHLTPELAKHIADQISTEGAHAIVKSVEWGDGAADELVQFIKAALLKLASVGSMKEATTTRDKWNKASAERQQKHDKIAATQTKNGSGMKSAINRLEKHVNAKEGWTHDSLADQLFEHERTYEEKLQNQLNKLTKK